MTTPSIDRLTELTIDRLTDLASTASGWDHASITFRRDIAARYPCISASVEICGQKIAVSASGSSHREALAQLVRNIEQHHRDAIRWHRQRCIAVREILDAHAVWYPPGDL